MDERKVAVSSRGFGLCTVLFLIFLVLKLAEIGAVADWSWWAVLSPWYILPLVFFILWVCLVGTAAALTIAANMVGSFGRWLRKWREERESRRTRG